MSFSTRFSTRCPFLHAAAPVDLNMKFTTTEALFWWYANIDVYCFFLQRPRPSTSLHHVIESYINNKKTMDEDDDNANAPGEAPEVLQECHLHPLHRVHRSESNQLEQTMASRTSVNLSWVNMNLCHNCIQKTIHWSGERETS